MITSALIAQLRRDCGDEPKSVRVGRQGNGSINLLNVGKFPVIENSYTVFVSGVAKTDVTDYTFDLDNGDIRLTATPANGIEVRSQHKYANWRDQNWIEAIGTAIEHLNARGFFRQVVRQGFVFTAGSRVVSGPSACVDLYELLTAPTSGQVSRLGQNWSYQQDGNKVVLGSPFSQATSGVRSYLRNLQIPTATSSTLDVLPDWVEIVKAKATEKFYRFMAGKIAKQGNANIDEGHFSFTNLRTMANDADAQFDILARRKKPTRPAKEISPYNRTGGVA